MTRKQMIKKLSNFDDPEPGFEGYGCSADDEIELMVMLSGMVSGQRLHEDEDMARADAGYAMQAIRENAVGGAK